MMFFWHNNSTKNWLILSAFDHYFVLYCLQHTKIFCESCYQLSFFDVTVVELQKEKEKAVVRHTGWKQHMWHSDRNNNNTLTEQPTLGG